MLLALPLMSLANTDQLAAPPLWLNESVSPLAMLIPPPEKLTTRLSWLTVKVP